MGLLHLALLLASIGCVALVDRRFRLFVWADPWRAVLIVVVCTLFLLAWDVAGIAAGVFRRDANAISTGILLAPHLPIEEPVFLVFLVQVTMTVYTGASRVLRDRQASRR